MQPKGKQEFFRSLWDAANFWESSSLINRRIKAFRSGVSILPLHYSLPRMPWGLCWKELEKKLLVLRAAAIRLFVWHLWHSAFRKSQLWRLSFARQLNQRSHCLLLEKLTDFTEPQPTEIEPAVRWESSGFGCCVSAAFCVCLWATYNAWSKAQSFGSKNFAPTRRLFVPTVKTRANVGSYKSHNKHRCTLSKTVCANSRKDWLPRFR